MIEEMYKDFRKHKDEESSASKQDKGEEESLLHDHSKGKGKEESFRVPPNRPEHKKKASLIKLDVKFDLPIYDGELNVEKLDNWIRQIDIAEVRLFLIAIRFLEVFHSFLTIMELFEDQIWISDCIFYV